MRSLCSADLSRDPCSLTRSQSIGVSSTSAHVLPSLTSLTLEITAPPTRKPESTRDIPRVPLAEVCIVLLADIPATVRVLTIKLWGTSKPAEIKSAKTLGLRALDAALDERHTHLERVEVILDTYMVDCLEALTRVMPTELRTRGLLAVIGKLD